MAERLKLSASSRSWGGKGRARRMRQQGLIPGVVYGRGMDSIPVVVAERDLSQLFQLTDYESELIDLRVDDGDPMDVLVKETQFDHIGERLLHIDFFRITRGEKLDVEVPIVVLGTAEGVKMGGILQNNMRAVKIRCLPKDLIHELRIDVSALGVGDSIHIRDLNVPDTIEILEEPQRTVVTVLAKKVEEKAPEEEAPEEEAATEAKEPVTE
ncbi:MAG: 50S ribosomal protein L25 [Candidatus Coatesbacteria bacterium]|nr:MAG: 50S ribosomal protein L25 [Candidatus Coatesbacteria bacterium]